MFSRQVKEQIREAITHRTNRETAARTNLRTKSRKGDAVKWLSGSAGKGKR